MEDNNKRISDHLANERTFLAWIRTGIGVMAFGFVVVKFSLFVKQLAALVGKDHVVEQRGYSSLLGILLVGAGLAITLFAYWRFKRTEREINENSYKSASSFITIIVTFITLISILLLMYLMQSI
jgi:putative membrane protein